MDTFASIALCSEPPRPGVMQLPPKRKDENIVTPAMVQDHLHHGGFFIVTMMALLIGMKYGPLVRAAANAWPGDGRIRADLTIRQVSIFFTVYVFFQVWNQINCRSLTPETSGFSGILSNPTFLTIAGTVAVVQVLIISVPSAGRHLQGGAAVAARLAVHPWRHSFGVGFQRRSRGASASRRGNVKCASVSDASQKRRSGHDASAKRR